MSDLQWSPQQDQALIDVERWRRDPQRKPVYYLGGYAGTGKTTLAMHLVQGAKQVAFLAYTGKAALVLQQRGCPNAGTIHSAIYRAQGEARDPKVVALRAEIAALEHELEKTREAGADDAHLLNLIVRAQEALARTGKGKKAQPLFGLRDEGASIIGCDLVVVDECSMVGDRIYKDLLSFKVPILALGDPFQLPPVGDGGGFTRGKPDFTLTEIHRHARESGILRLATAIREGDSIPTGVVGPDCRVVPKGRGSLGEQVMLEADQVIVGNNKTRKAFNNRFRQLLGHLETHGPGPGPGDRVICLRNDDRTEFPMLNGAQWAVTKADNDFDNMRSLMDIDGLDQPGVKTTVESHLQYFVNREHEIEDYDHRKAQEFTYAYAVTCHKAQGSQWGKVVVWDESQNFSQYGYDPRRHLYTAVTRAQHDLTVAR